MHDDEHDEDDDENGGTPREMDPIGLRGHAPPPFDSFHWNLRVTFSARVPRYLEGLGVPQWQPVLEAWWDRWDGIEAYLGSLADPRVMGAQALRDANLAGEFLSAEQLTRILVDQRHTHYTARRPGELVATWNPLAMTFARFSGGSREPGRLSVSGTHFVWLEELDHPHPSRDMLESWLMTRLVRAQMDDDETP